MEVTVILSYHGGDDITFVTYKFGGIKTAISFVRTACSATRKVDSREKSSCTLYSFHIGNEDMTNELKSLEGLGGHA